MKITVLIAGALVVSIALVVFVVCPQAYAPLAYWHAVLRSAVDLLQTFVVLVVLLSVLSLFRGN